MSREDLFSIRQMVELTGLSEFTIRGWENRYAAFSPARGDTGRRGYLKSDIERALLLRELLKRGFRIGKIAPLSNSRLKALFGESSATPMVAENPDSAAVQQAMELMALQKWVELRAFLADIPQSDPRRLVADFVLPAVKALAMNVAAGMVSISQEHIFSSFLKEKIYSAISSLDRNGPAQKLRYKFVLAAPEGDFHEIGLLLAHLILRARGHSSLYIGAHTPALDLAETSLRFGATHVLVVSTISKSGGARQDVLAYIRDLQKKIGDRPRILLAGNQVPHLEEQEGSPLVHIATFEALENYLDKLTKRKLTPPKRK